MLQRVQPEYTADLAGADTSQLTIELTYRGGKMTCYPEGWIPPGTLPPIGPERLSVEMQAKFVTSDGQFVEAFLTSLDLTPVTEYITFGYSVRDQDQLQGTSRADVPGYEHVAVTTYGTLNRETTSGAVSMHGWSRKEKRYSGTASSVVARWAGAAGRIEPDLGRHSELTR